MILDMRDKFSPSILAFINQVPVLPIKKHIFHHFHDSNFEVNAKKKSLILSDYICERCSIKIIFKNNSN
jgi:hypothetical protein